GVGDHQLALPRRVSHTARVRGGHTEYHRARRVAVARARRCCRLPGCTALGACACAGVAHRAARKARLAVASLMLFRLAWATLSRHRTRTALAILGVAVSAAMLLDMVMLSSGMRVSFRNLLLSQGFQLRISPKGTLP